MPSKVHTGRHGQTGWGLGRLAGTRSAWSPARLSEPWTPALLGCLLRGLEMPDPGSQASLESRGCMSRPGLTPVERRQCSRDAGPHLLTLGRRGLRGPCGTLRTAAPARVRWQGSRLSRPPADPAPCRPSGGRVASPLPWHGALLCAPCVL